MLLSNPVRVGNNGIPALTQWTLASTWCLLSP
jgi:hypothetical protein